MKLIKSILKFILPEYEIHEFKKGLRVLGERNLPINKWNFISGARVKITNKGWFSK